MSTRTKKATPKKAPAIVSKGWECPRCDRIHAPDVKECACKKEATRQAETESAHRQRLREMMERWKQDEMKRPKMPTPPPMEWPSLPYFEPIPDWRPWPIYYIPCPQPSYPPGTVVCDQYR